MSEPLSPAAMAAVTAAARGRGLAPRAVRHFGLAAMEARAARAREAMPPPVMAYPPVAAPPPRPVRVRLWLPLSVLFLMFAPFALVLALPFYLVPPRLRPDPVLTALGVGRLLLSLSGTDVDVQTPDAIVRVKIF